MKIIEKVSHTLAGNLVALVPHSSKNREAKPGRL